MSNQRKWERYQQLQQASVHSADNIAQLQSILNDESSLQECMVELGNVTHADARKHVRQTIKDNEKHIEECEENMHKISKLLKRKGYDVDAYDLSLAVTDAQKHENSTWRKYADADLESKRPCKITENNITRIVPLGASGYWRDCEKDEEEDEHIDVLDDSASPMQHDDTEAKLNIFSHSSDLADKEDPDAVVESSAIVIQGFRLPGNIVHLLKPHQKDAVHRILKTVGVEASGYLLAHSMGLGKTLTTIAVIEAFFLKNPKFRVVVACPKSCINTTWYDELDRWDEALDDQLSFKYFAANDDKSLNKDIVRWSKRGGVIIMGHDRFRMCQSGDTPLEFDFLVFDEGHMLKNPDTLMYKAVNNLQVSRKLLLTGSPLQNHLTEYGSMIRLINPHVFDESVFKKEFADVIDRGMMADASDSDMSKARTQIEVLTRMTEDIVHRRSSTLLQMSLPDMHEFKLTYKAPLPTNSSSGIFGLTQDTMTCALDKKVALACSLIRRIQRDTNDKILVFSWRKDVLQALSDNIPGLVMDGKCSTSQRQDMIDSFQRGNANVFYMTTKVGSVGLNLFVANRVLILDPAWNPTDDKQACFRAYRYGQTKPVYIYRFVVYNSIEERIYRLAVHKNLAACRIVDERDVERHFTSEQLNNMDDFDEHTLDDAALSTIDPILCSILPKLVSCCSHDVLFADAEEEELSNAEKADADNQCNLMNSLQPLRSISGTDDVTHTMEATAIRFDDGTLVPPFTMSYSVIGARDRAAIFSKHGTLASYIRTFHPIRPLSSEITSHDLEYSSVEWNGSFDKAAECQHNDWELHFRRHGAYRVRSRARCGNEVSAWSAWSAEIVV